MDSNQKSKNKLDRYQLYKWLNHAYDSNLVRHQIIEDIYNQIKNKIDSLELELKYTEDEFYLQIIQFLIDNSKKIK